jgi:hypothetical protein
MKQEANFDPLFSMKVSKGNMASWVKCGHERWSRFFLWEDIQSLKSRSVRLPRGNNLD